MTCNSTDYQFIRTPLKLFLCLDNNCRAMLISLIQLSDWAMNKGENQDGWFYRSNALLSAETKLSRKVMDGALDALLKKNLIDFIPQPQGMGVNQETRRYKVNFDAFDDFEQYTVEECLDEGNPKFQIVTSDYKKGAFTWRGKEWAGKPASLSLSDTPASTMVSPQPQPKVPTSIDTIENKDIINKNNNKLLNINYLNNTITSIESNSAERSNRSRETMESPSSSLNDSLEHSNETEHHPSSSHNPSSPHDDCLKYIITHKAPHSNDGLDEKDYVEYCLATALVKMVNREVKHLPNDESVFFEAVKNYMELYGVSRERAIKDINILKSRARKIRDEQLKEVA